MISNDVRYRVYNRCKYDIGVQLINGVQHNIKPDSFQLLSADDILYIESICNVDKFFAKKMLVVVDTNGKEVDLAELGIAAEESAALHHNDEEIIAALKQSVKKIEAWLSTIEDPAELHSIYEVAVKLDLPASKLSVLDKKIPDKDWLGKED